MVDMAGGSQRVARVDDGGDESDGSDASTQTMIFQASEEQLEVLEPMIKRRKVVFGGDVAPRVRLPRVKVGHTADDADDTEFSSRVADLGGDDEEEDVELGVGVAVSAALWARLYGYQRSGVQWLLRLHERGVGGILGDEMGLGKTAQVIVFLEALRHGGDTNGEGRHTGTGEARQRHTGNDGQRHTSGIEGPVLVVCPATVMRQWVDEFRSWAPMFRVALLHASGTGYDKPVRERER